jgi:hypothetical protein
MPHERDRSKTADEEGQALLKELMKRPEFASFKSLPGTTKFKIDSLILETFVNDLCKHLKSEAAIEAQKMASEGAKV